MKVYLDNIIVNCTPEELVKYQELLKDKGLTNKASTELKVGDKVKVLKSESGAEGVATVTAVLGDGSVELEGTSKEGIYLTDWRNKVANLEKIEEKPLSFEGIQAKAYLEDKSIDQVVEEEHRGTEADNSSKFYRVNIDISELTEGTVLKKVDRDTYVDSLGHEYSGEVHHVSEPIKDPIYIETRFNFAKQVGIVLNTDTNFAVECERNIFKVTDDERMSSFSTEEVLNIVKDDKTDAIKFRNEVGMTQYTALQGVKPFTKISNRIIEAETY